MWSEAEGILANPDGESHHDRAKCDQHPNWCNAKALSFWHFASVVMGDGEESYTTNLCQQCYKKIWWQKEMWQWYAVVEKKAHRGMLWRMLGKDQYIRGMWEYSFERLKVTKFREEAEKEKQEGIQGQWPRESPAKEYLEQGKCCKDTDCTPRTTRQARTMGQAFFALKRGDGKEYNSIFRVQAKPRNGPLIEYRRPS